MNKNKTQPPRFVRKPINANPARLAKDCSIKVRALKPLIHRENQYLDCDTVLHFLCLCPSSADVGDFLCNSRYPAHRGTSRVRSCGGDQLQPAVRAPRHTDSKYSGHKRKRSTETTPEWYQAIMSRYVILNSGDYVTLNHTDFRRLYHTASHWFRWLCHAVSKGLRWFSC